MFLKRNEKKNHLLFVIYDMLVKLGFASPKNVGHQ